MQVKNRNSHGFTLIEIVIAMAIIAIAILTFYTIQSRSIKGNSKAKGISMAAMDVQNQMETFLGIDFDDAQLNNGGPRNLAIGNSRVVSSATITVTDWRTDGLDNDFDGLTDEFDERGVKRVQIAINYQDISEGMETKTMVIESLRTQIFQ